MEEVGGDGFLFSMPNVSRRAAGGNRGRAGAGVAGARPGPRRLRAQAVPRQPAGILITGQKGCSMTKRDHWSRASHVLALGAAGATGRSGSRAGADAPLPEIPPIPEKLKGSGELRIADVSAAPCRTPNARPISSRSRSMSGIKVHDFPGADLNKVKAMVETGTVEWDVVQLSQGSVQEPAQARRLFREDRLRPGGHGDIEPVYRTDYALRHAGVGGGDGLSHRCVQRRGAGGLGGFLGHQEVPG